ncbi:MAG TPA: FHIPEP family type III secretion protein, partial [Aquamicrobium sp.]|nr:FHIPEP family type III secretion protein [Aquamicrobium sp.]
MALIETASLPTARNYGRDVALAFGVILILSILFLPIPAFLIDFGLALSIAVSVLILMVALWMQKPLDFT